MNDDLSRSGRKGLLIALSLLVALFAALHLTGGMTLWAALLGGVAGISILIFTARAYNRLILRLGDAIKVARAPRRHLAPLRAKITEGIDAPLFLLDPTRKVLDANQPARQLFGERLVGRDISLHLRHPDILDAITAVIKNDEPQKIEASITGSVDRIFSVRVARVFNNTQGETGATPPLDEPGFYIVVSMFDITQVKMAERMRADFVANASHELRTPLSSVIGFIETLQGPAKGDTQASERFLTIMHNEALRMVRLIDDLLSLSRIELDKHLQPETSADVAKILKSIVTSMEPAASSRNITLTLETPPDLPLVQGDGDQIHQMVQNLVSNAIKYTHKDTTVTLSAETNVRIMETGQPGLAIKVADKGPGIAAEHLPRLTERFYRVDPARSRKMGGTGLGLAIVKHIVTRHRGHIDIRSIVGAGTTVTVSLPLFREKVSEKPQG